MDTLLEHWAGYLAAIGEPNRQPRFAAVLDIDVTGRPTSSEFEAFRMLFEKRGIEAAILEPEHIAYDGGKLVTVESGEVEHSIPIFEALHRLAGNPEATLRNPDRTKPLASEGATLADCLTQFGTLC